MRVGGGDEGLAVDETAPLCFCVLLAAGKVKLHVLVGRCWKMVGGLALISMTPLT